MKIHILAKLQDGPSGGGNSFLINLRNEFRNGGVYSESVDGADVVIINSHNSFYDFPNLPHLLKDKTVVHRMDGLQKLYNHKDDGRQDVAIMSNNLAHYTIFQSWWSKREYEKVANFGPNKVIWNGVSDEFKEGTRENFKDGKIRVITSSWSTNLNKGFDDLAYIDYELRHGGSYCPNIEFSFIGNTPIKFNNIVSYVACDRPSICKLLQSSDIYFHPAKFEACSNSLLEGLACKLPCVYANSGSNHELVLFGGLWYIDKEGIMDKITRIAENYEKFKSRIPSRPMKDIAQRYNNVCFDAMISHKGCKA